MRIRYARDGSGRLKWTVLNGFDMFVKDITTAAEISRTENKVIGRVQQANLRHRRTSHDDRKDTEDGKIMNWFKERRSPRDKPGRNNKTFLLNI